MEAKSRDLLVVPFIKLCNMFWTYHLEFWKDFLVLGTDFEAYASVNENDYIMVIQLFCFVWKP